MILPIYGYGQQMLRNKSEKITEGCPELEKLVADMFETMDKAQGVGLAAPQIGRNIRLVVVDGSAFAEDDELAPMKGQKDFLKNFRHTLINPVIAKQWGEQWGFEEGCLSLPTVYQKVMRPYNIRLEYLDENFAAKQMELNGPAARIVQHELDHLDGIVFTDLLSPLSKRVIEKKLDNIKRGRVQTSYPLKV